MMEEDDQVDKRRNRSIHYFILPNSASGAAVRRSVRSSYLSLISLPTLIVPSIFLKNFYQIGNFINASKFNFSMTQASVIMTLAI